MSTSSESDGHRFGCGLPQVLRDGHSALVMERTMPLLTDLQWAERPLIPQVSDPAWEAEVTALMGMVPDALRRVAPSRWVRRAYMAASGAPVLSLPDPERELAALVTS